MIANTVLDLVGNTPLLNLGPLFPEMKAILYGKAEFLNPMGSVKERPALAMVEEAERTGRLRPGMTIVEPTSGNTGLGLSMVGAVKGYKVWILVERDMAGAIARVARALGAQTILTENFNEAVRLAESIQKENPDRYFLPQQFTNPANPQIHVHTTAQEIFDDLGHNLCAFVHGYGSGGTFTGVARALKQLNPKIRCVLVEPDTLRRFSGGPVTGSQIHGIGPPFIPRNLDQELIDDTIAVSEEQGYEMVVKLARRCGVLCGPSSGAMVHAAARIAADYGSGDAVVTILPDRGDRYFGSDFFPETST
ncbi:MAG: cysteine synthase family protein [Magnetococcales bacterium]|nr:cysteine synthase family protein [Magnetococcales bacterium]